MTTYYNYLTKIVFSDVLDIELENASTDGMISHYMLIIPEIS